MVSHSERHARIIPVILAGGSGERLWPLSKVDYPKQFISFDESGVTLFQATLMRVADRTHFAAPIVVCNEEHRFIVSEQLRVIGCSDATIIVEPVARNTAPALVLAALHIAETAAETLMLALPSDHHIHKPSSLLQAVEAGVPAACEGRIVTFAITPDAPEVGYGYIRMGVPLGGHTGMYTIDRFVEKPDAATAASYLAEGGYGWNSGIFLMSAATVVSECMAHAPTIFDACASAYYAHVVDRTFVRPNTEFMAKCISLSFDLAVMEHTHCGAVIAVDIGWNDLGSWTALDDASLKDGQGNACIGRSITHDVSGCYIRSTDALVAAIGLRDMVVIAADNAVMVGPKDRMQEVKHLLTTMRASAIPDTHLTSFAHRPWGGFASIDRTPHYQVKRLHIKPGGKISLQAHRHRCEHWVVVSGRATVTRDGDVTILGPNASTFIPAGCAHRLENREESDLIVIEVQTGDYLGEDDIERFEDAYHRD